MAKTRRASRTTVIVTGDKEVTRQLASLGSRRAREFHRKSIRKAAKVVLEWARNIVPVQSGTYRRSLTVRALKKSRVFQGVRVTQREKAYTGKAFYGAFLEFGWKTGRRRAGEQAKPRRKIPGRWLLRKAGTVKEDEARGIYIAELKKFIDAEWHK